jgi:hypothetical protein
VGISKSYTPIPPEEVLWHETLIKDHDELERYKRNLRK